VERIFGGEVQATRGRIDWVQLFFSSSGRLARTPFLIAVAVLIAILAVYDAAVLGWARWLTGWLILSVLLFAGACILSKRLHDRGRSGWWATPILLAFVMAWPWPSGFVDFLATVMLIWAAVELGVMRGDQGFNRHGPPPA